MARVSYLALVWCGWPPSITIYEIPSPDPGPRGSLWLRVAMARNGQNLVID